MKLSKEKSSMLVQSIYDGIVHFFGSPFFSIYGGIAILVTIYGFFKIGILVIRGVFPVWYRLGLGLSKGTIAVFTSTQFSNIKSLLEDSKIFKKENIIEVHSNEIKKAADMRIFLVHWNDCKDCIDDIIAIKNDKTALIVYAPRDEGLIDDINMNKINNQRNSVVVNFRGRLLNDILTSLITISYKG